MSRHLHFPATLQRFRGLPGQYGSVDVTALNAHVLELQLVMEFVHLNRDDAREMVRVLTEWLAEPAHETVVHNAGGTVVVVDADGAPGTTGVTVIEERPRHGHGAGHYELPHHPRRP